MRKRRKIALKRQRGGAERRWLAVGESAIRVGPIQAPLGIATIGVSAALHAALLVTLGAIPSPSSDTAPPRVSFERGESSMLVSVASAAPLEMDEPPIERREAEPQPEPEPLPHAEEPLLLAVEESQLPETAISLPKEMAPTPSQKQAETAPSLSGLTQVAFVELIRRLSSSLDRGSDMLERMTTLMRQEQEKAHSKTAPAPAQPVKQKSIEKTRDNPVQESSNRPASTPSIQSTGAESPASIHNMPAPLYPLLSRLRSEEGLVVLDVEVLTDGSVGAITVIEDPGYPRLRRAAIEAIRRATFEPATKHGQPVRASVRVPIRFRLTD